MKVTKRDLILLVVLVYIIVVVCGVMFLVKPQLENKEKYDNEYDQIVFDKGQKDNNIAQIPSLEKKIGELKEEINTLKTNFYEYRENPELHIQTLITAELGSATKLNDLTIVAAEVPTAAKTVTDSNTQENPDIDVPEDSKTIANDEAQPVQIVSTDVTIKVEGSVDNLLAFAEQIQNLKNVIEFNSVYIESKDAQDASNVVYIGTYVLSFVSVF